MKKMKRRRWRHPGGRVDRSGRARTYRGRVLARPPVAWRLSESEQFSRSAGHQATPSLTAMCSTIHWTILPHDAPDSSFKEETA